MSEVTDEIQPRQQWCGKKLGDPGPQGMRLCNQPYQYVAATPPEFPYSGYRHNDRLLDADHYPVPKSWLS